MASNFEIPSTPKRKINRGENHSSGLRINGFKGLDQLACIVLRKITIIVFLAFVSSLSVNRSWSHPHVFVSTSVDMVFDDKGLAGFRIMWLFDDMFSSMIILDFDKNNNKRLEASEIKSIKKGAFSNLSGFDYFTHIKIEGKPFKVKYVNAFNAKIFNDRLVYEFFVPCHVPALDSFKEVTLAVYDMTFYSSVSLMKNPVTYENQKPYEIEHRIERNVNEAYYYGQIYPEEITLRFKRKNG